MNLERSSLLNFESMVRYQADGAVGSLIKPEVVSKRALDAKLQKEKELHPERFGKASTTQVPKAQGSTQLAHISEALDKKSDGES